MEQTLHSPAAHDSPLPIFAYLSANGHTKLCFKCYYKYKIKEPTLKVLEIIKVCLKHSIY